MHATKVSILGDSLSTYEGCNPEGFAVFYDREKQRANGLKSANDTWWAKVISAMGGTLCVNNSYSGSMVSGMGFPSGSSQERLTRLGTASAVPDVILVYLGFNDFGRGVQISPERSGLLGKLHASRDLNTFEDAYLTMLKSITARYSSTQVVCGTLMRTKMRGKSGEEWNFPEHFARVGFGEYNEAIRKACRKRRVLLADLAKPDVRYETLDGSHATAIGHQTMADAWIRSLRNLGLTAS